MKMMAGGAMEVHFGFGLSDRDQTMLTVMINSSVSQVQGTAASVVMVRYQVQETWAPAVMVRYF